MPTDRNRCGARFLYRTRKIAISVGERENRFQRNVLCAAINGSIWSSSVRAGLATISRLVSLRAHKAGSFVPVRFAHDSIQTPLAIELACAVCLRFRKRRSQQEQFANSCHPDLRFQKKFVAQQPQSKWLAIEARARRTKSSKWIRSRRRSTSFVRSARWASGRCRLASQVLFEQAESHGVFRGTIGL